MPKKPYFNQFVFTIMIPTTEDLQLPIMKLLSDDEPHEINEVELKMASKFDISQDELQQLTAVARRKRFGVRVRWAVSQLRQARLLSNIKRGVFKITESGSKLLQTNPSKIDTKFLMSIPAFREWLNKSQISEIKKSIKKEKKKINFIKGIIVLLDVLGTKGKWKTNNPAKISKRWDTLITTFEDAIKKALHGKNLTPSFLTFSDTIMIIIKTEEIPEVLIQLASSLRAPFVVSMMIEMPLRGCISTGKFHHDKTLIIGPAIDEAAAYYDLPQWVGISAAPSANREITKINQSNPTAVKENFFMCDIPLKESIEQNAWALKWTENSDKTISETSKSLKSHYNNTIGIIDSQLSNDNPIDVALKWRNTLRFYKMNNAK